MAALQPLDDAADRVLGLGVDDEPSLDVVPAPAGTGPQARRRWRFRRSGGKKGIAFWLAVAWLATVAFCAIFATRLPLGSFSASPVAADGRLYFTSETGEVHVLRAGADYQLLTTNAMDEIVMATPAISDGLLVIRTVSQVVGIAEGEKLAMQ